MNHHAVFAQFAAPPTGEPPLLIDSFLGTRVSQKITGVTPLPAFDEEYFEWIDLLEAVLEARGQFTMIELGAGYGRWSVRAALACWQKNLKCKVIAVEAEPEHFEWMKRNFADNRVDGQLIRAAVTAEGGEAQFYVRMGQYKSDNWYGQSANTEEPESVSMHETYYGFTVFRQPAGRASIKIPAVTLNEILAPLDRVDLIDFDLQGEESSVIHASIDALNAKVKRLHVGTHSKQIDEELLDLLPRNGWRCQACYLPGVTVPTPCGLVSFGDGVQSWVNSYFLP